MRLAKGRHIDADAAGNLRIGGAAFVWSKAGDGDLGLSVNWLDYFEGAFDDKLTSVRAAMHMQPSAKDRFTLMRVGHLLQLLAQEASLTVSVLHDPTPAQPPRYPDTDLSHAAIAGLPDNSIDEDNALRVADLIAKLAVHDHFPARGDDKKKPS